MSNETNNSTFTPADKATGLSALALANETKANQCPSPEELSCLVDGKSETGEKEKLLLHLANCQQCYNQWLVLSRVSQESGQNKIISGPWKKIIKIGSPILAVAASVAIFLNIFGPSYTVSPPFEEASTSPATTSENVADVERMDLIQQEAPPQPPPPMAKPSTKERAQRKNFSAAPKAMITEQKTLLGAALPAQTQPQTFVYTCNDGFEFVARIEGENAWLFLPGNTVKATHVPSGSGAKYTKESIVFWNKGKEALLATDGTNHFECRNDRARATWEHAKLNGVSFRAVGNEPGWELTITHGENVVFITDYGQKQYSVPTPEPITDQLKKQTTYTIHSNGNTLEVLLQTGPCQDSMADISYETQVIVTLNGKQYRGCGRALH